MLLVKLFNSKLKQLSCVRFKTYINMLLGMHKNVPNIVSQQTEVFHLACDNLSYNSFGVSVSHTLIKVSPTVLLTV